MDDLQLGLIGAGVAVVLGVVGYNALQSAKIRRTLPRLDCSDMLSQNQERSDELSSEHAEHAPGAFSTDSVRCEPSFGGSSIATPHDNTSAEATNTSGGGEAERPSIIDARIDCVALLHWDTPVAAEKVMPWMQRLRHAGSKPVWMEGQIEAGAWQAIQAGGRYDALRVAVQYANRSGPLNEVEFSEFMVGIQALADALDAGIECPDMVETVTRARELDAFAARCDQQLAIHLISEDAPWAARTVQRVAAQDGLTLSRDGLCFMRRDEWQNPIFRLQFNDTNFLRDDLDQKSGRMIQLLLDIPLADPEIQPFQKMVDYARALSQRLGARVVDDRQRSLTETALREIEAQLSVLYRTLNAAGMPAGSPAARRLFSQ